MKRKKQTRQLATYFGILGFIIFLLFIVASSNSTSSIIVSNINNIKSIETSRRINFSSLNLDKLETNLYQAFKVFSISEVAANKDKVIEFEGTLTGYGPDCVGCSGNLGCAPYQNIKNGNIYYEDNQYGKIRILAADRSIPCGSIVKISNFRFIDGDFYGIVLDRGSAINGLTMDLLYNSEEETKKLGRSYNINFKIERWGY